MTEEYDITKETIWFTTDKGGLGRISPNDPDHLAWFKRPDGVPAEFTYATNSAPAPTE